MGIAVKSIKWGSSAQGNKIPKCKCKNWKEHWEINSDKSFENRTCAVNSCPNTAEVGAHIQIKDSEGDYWYIIPLYKTCNSYANKEIFMVSEKTHFVRVTQCCNR